MYIGTFLPYLAILPYIGIGSLILTVLCACSSTAGFALIGSATTGLWSMPVPITCSN